MLVKFQIENVEGFITRAALVRDLYAWIWETSRPIPDVAELLLWCERHTDRSAEEFAIMSAESLIELGNQILAASCFDSAHEWGFARIRRVSTGAIDYDKSLADKRCECPECEAIRNDQPAEPSELCLYRCEILDDGSRREVTGLASKVLAPLRPTLMREFWDLPVSLYRLAIQEDVARNLGAAVPTQKRKREQERDAIRDDVFSRHGM